MAVAPVAVELGPRNKRRLMTGTVMLGASVAALLMTRPAGRPGSSSAAHSGRPAASSARLVFGMTPQRVRHITGEPVRTHGGCWFFQPTKTGTVGSISVQPAFATALYDARTTGQLELCFVGGVYSYSYLRLFIPSRHRWEWTAWPLNLFLRK
jgi:hypothetical protein